MRMKINKRVLWTTIGFICLSGFTTFFGLFCLGGYLVLYGSPDTDKYKTYGRDTVTHFGEGRFQVLRTPGGKRELKDLDTHDTLLFDVTDWRERNNFAYVCASDGKYVVIQTVSNEFWEFSDIDNIPDEHQPHVRKLRVRR